MQQTIFEPENLPEIANPSMIEHLLFESGLTSAIILFAVALLAAFILSKAAKSKPAMVVLLIGFLASAGVYGASVLVTTDREYIAQRLESLVISVADGDESTMRLLLGESVRVRTAFGGAQGREQVTRLASTRAAPLISDVRVSDIRVGLSGPRVARSTVKIKATSDAPLGKSIWIVDWSRPNEDTSEWVVTHIEPFWIQGMSNPAGN